MTDQGLNATRLVAFRNYPKTTNVQIWKRCWRRLTARRLTRPQNRCGNPRGDHQEHRQLLPDLGSRATLLETGTTATGILNAPGLTEKTTELEEKCLEY